MFISDFEYDGLVLSDMGYIVCRFDSKGIVNVSNGAHITFNTVPVHHGRKHKLVGIKYDKCLETQIYICKDPCVHDDMHMTVREIRELATWLNRDEFLKFKVLNDEYCDIYFESSFNIEKVEYDDEVIGLKLDMKTNRPFALLEPRTYVIKAESVDSQRVIIDESDISGYIYPDTKITVSQDGDLTIYNEIEDRYTIIRNCVAGEEIEMCYPIIKSTNTNHNWTTDFNWTFFRIANKFRNSRNVIQISSPCTIKIKYSPTANIGL